MLKTMNGHDHPQRGCTHERGQVLAMFGAFLFVLLLFVGLGIDVGFAYITQARLSKAVDAAALAGMSNYYQGTTNATLIAKAAFAANFSPNTNDAAPGYVTGTPIPSITFSNSFTSTSSNVYLSVSATATNKTFFISVLPQWRHLVVSDSGQATRLPLIMTLVLDHSYSMCPSSVMGCTGPGFTGGGQYLPNAVTSFIGDFDQDVDQVAVVTFGSTASNNVPMTSQFVTPITTEMNYAKNNPSMYWTGYTASEVGLTNALNIENSVGSTATAVKVAVFFTDGLANGIEGELTCPTACTPGYTTGKVNRWTFATAYDFDGDTSVVLFPTNVLMQDQLNPCCQTPTCCNGTQYSTTNGALVTLNYLNVQNDATNRCVMIANQMRQLGMYVFCVGLDNAGNGDVPDPAFLQAVANDPDGPPAYYNPALPAGVALVTGNGSDLAQLFQLIAAQIQLRLTH